MSESGYSVGIVRKDGSITPVPMEENEHLIITLNCSPALSFEVYSNSNEHPARFLLIARESGVITARPMNGLDNSVLITIPGRLLDG